MLVTKSDFIQLNELLFPLESKQEVDYYTLVKENAKIGAVDDDITEDEYIHTRLVFGFKHCLKLRTKTNYELFLRTDPKPVHIAQIMGFDSHSIKYLEPKFIMPTDGDDIYNVLMACSEFVNINNLDKLISSKPSSLAFYVTNLICKYSQYQTFSILGKWVATRPTIRHIEQVLTEVPVSHHKLILSLYIQTKGDKTYAPIVKEVAEKINETDLLKGFTMDGRW